MSAEATVTPGVMSATPWQGMDLRIMPEDAGPAVEANHEARHAGEMRCRNLAQDLEVWERLNPGQLPCTHDEEIGA